ncbi:MAG: helix-turn-helix domain-containing protein [Coriobacteriales bacterium]|jgi:DNA-binding XRE family transcriptional regulator|nr:helix-turn-helix domain-containing protein [Coriobacteriales bacterium]
METKEILAELRKSKGLTQDEMAEKLLVTRQAVSRWETGETTPNVDTLKLLSKEFEVSINQLLGEPQTNVCQSCAMPLQNIEELGTETDGGISTEYCAHCYQDGSFTHNRSMEEMAEGNLEYLDHWNAGQGTNYTKDEARAILQTHLATLKRWKTT